MSRWRVALVSLAMVMAGAASVVVATPDTASAAAKCKGGGARLLTFPAWYNGLVKEDCSIDSAKFVDAPGKKDTLRNTIFRIILNVVEMILQLVAYTTVVFLILGGFNYMTAAGDSGKISGAKKTIEHAIVGLVIALMSIGIVNLVAGAL